jgi:hypothetical protein
MSTIESWFLILMVAAGLYTLNLSLERIHTRLQALEDHLKGDAARFRSLHRQFEILEEHFKIDSREDGD